MQWVKMRLEAVEGIFIPSPEYTKFQSGHWLEVGPGSGRVGPSACRLEFSIEDEAPWVVAW